MGAIDGSIIGYGMSVSEAFNECYQEAEEEHGHEQGYSGAINCTSLAKNVTARYKAAKDKNKFIEELYEEIDKRDCYYVVLEEPKKNTNKIKSKVTTYPQKGARKWETTFEIMERFGFDDRVAATAKSQTEAIKKARKLAEDTQKVYAIYITKRLASGNNKVAEISYKQSSNEKRGKYLFIYVAPY